MSYDSLAATIGASVSSVISKEEELSTLKDTVSETYNTSFALGIGANQANQLFQDARSLADAASEELNFLAAGALVDKLGETIDLDELRALVIKNTSIDASLIIGGAAANQMGLFGAGADTLVLPPSGVYIYLAPDASGLDVSTNGTLKLEHNGDGSSALVYNILVLGSS